MHDPFLVHGRDSIEQTLHNLKDLISGETVPFLNFIIEQTST